MPDSHEPTARRGRPRLHADASAREAAATAALTAAGGAKRSIRLSPDAVRALAAVRAASAAPSDTAVIERALLDAEARISGK